MNEEMTEDLNVVKSERKKGIWAIVLMVVAMYGVIMPVIFAYMSITGSKDIPGWVMMMPIFSLMLLMPIILFMYRDAIKKDIKRLNVKTFLTIIVFEVILLLLNQLWLLLLDGRLGNQQTLESNFQQYSVVMTLYMLISAPILEELVLRKGLNGIIRKNKVLFVVVSAVLFGVCHWSGLGTIIYISMGACFALAYMKTERNIVTSILLHILNNTIGVVAMLITQL